MTYQTGYRFGPEFTHPVIKKLMWLVGGGPIIAALLQPLFISYISMPGPIDWFSLSWHGISKFMLWQPFTYLFVEEVYGGLSVWFFVQIFFSVYLIWILGSAILQAVGKKEFLTLFFVTGFVAAVLALLAMPVVGYYPVLAGATPVILGLMMVWTMLHPEMEVLLFFTLPLPARWLVAGILGIFLLIHGTQGNLVGIGFYLGGAFAAYFYAVLAWDLRSPFPVTHPFERMIARWGQTEWSQDAKIFDFKTGKAIHSDEKFMDEMLSKISQQGEGSLTWWERWKMRRISKRQNKPRS